MKIELLNEFIYKKSNNTQNKNLRIPDNIKPLEKGSYLIKIYKLELGV